MTTIHDLSAEQIRSAFAEFKERYAVTNPKPVKPSVGELPRLKLRNNWRAWAFGPVAIAGVLVSAMRTAAAAVEVAAVPKVLPFIPPQVEAILAVVAVDVTIVVGMLVWAYSRLQNLSFRNLKKEMEQMRLLKVAVFIAVTIALIANVTQVIREQFGNLDPRIDFAFKSGNALAFSVGMVFLAMVGSEQLAYLLAWTHMQNLEIQQSWRQKSEKALDGWQTAADEWEVKVVRAWNSQKSKILDLTIQKRPKPIQQLVSLPSGTWTKPRKLDYIVQLVSSLCLNGIESVTYAELKGKLGTIPRATFYVYVGELVNEGRLEKASDGRGWRTPLKEGF